MKKTFTLLVILTISLITIGQQFNPYHYVKNGVINDSKLVLDLMDKKHPGYKNQVQETFDRNKLGTTKSGQTYTINTVVHVVWKNNEENIHDSIIERQIEILNEDYGRTNPDSVNLRPIFTSIAGNPNIQFNLTEIKRVQTSETFALSFTGLPDNVKETANGGSDASNTEYFLNIWVCNIDGGLLGALFGYAYPPAGLSHWPNGSDAPSTNLEGVVLDYRTVGDNNPNPYTDPNGGGNIDFRGRTGTHEVGHYLGLRHIWGDGGGFFGGDSCGDDDGCNDTPNQGAQSNFNCDTNLNTCIDSIGGQPSPNDMPDLIENHMDYSAESCKNMFSNDQISIIRSVLENERVGLLSDATTISEHNTLSTKIYPNPSTGNLSIEIYDKLTNASIRIVDLLGKTIFKTEALSSQTLHLENLNKGIYLVEITNNNKISLNKIIIK